MYSVPYLLICILWFQNTTQIPCDLVAVVRAGPSLETRPHDCIHTHTQMPQHISYISLTHTPAGTPFTPTANLKVLVAAAAKVAIDNDSKSQVSPNLCTMVGIEINF